MDLSQVSTEDLQAYKAGNLGAVSTDGLMAIRGLHEFHETPKERNFGETASDLARLAARGATLGGAEIIGAELATPAIYAGKNLFTDDKISYQQAREDAYKTSRKDLDAYTKEHPYLSAGAQIAGGLATVGAAGPSAGFRGVPGVIPRMQNVAENAGSAALGAFAYGANTTPGSMGDKIKAGGEMAAPAAAIVGAAGTLGAPLINLTLHPVKTAVDAAKRLDQLTDYVAAGASKAINRADIPKELSGLPDPELLFVKSLADEGVTVDDALNSLKEAKTHNATPSVAVTANVPQMQTQAYLTSRGSAGSKVAAEAIKDIDDNQIPMLNKSIIDQATGGKNLGAEEYGKVVATEAKKLVDAKAARLRSRASPYYAKSVGVDKSVPIENEAMKKALGNPLAVKALEDYRTDPFTLTNAVKELGDLGVDAGDLAKLPLNSTVALHAARVHLRQLGDAAFSAGEKAKGAAIRNALNDIDAAIESTYPDYKTARRIYSEDAGALKVLKDSPVGRMATFAEGDYSKIANELMAKDAGYIRKFISGMDDNQKMRDSIAGAFLKRQLEESANDGRRFSDKVFKSEGTSERLKAIVGDERFAQMKKVDTVIDDLLRTRSIPSQSITAAAQSVKQGVNLPTDKAGVLDMVRKKIAPSLFEMVQRDPASAARYNQLLFTDEGYKLLEQISAKSKMANPKEMKAVMDFLNANADKVKAP